MPSIGILSNIDAGIGSCEKIAPRPLSVSSRASAFRPRLTSQMRKEKIGSARACCSSNFGKGIASFGFRMTNAPYRTLLPSNAHHTACTSSPVRYLAPQRGRVTLRESRCRSRTFVHQQLDPGLFLLKMAGPVLRVWQLLLPRRQAGRRSGR
jgi:hypothetical protein